MSESSWRWWLARQVDDLGPMPRGRYVPDPEPAAERAPAERLFDTGYLRACIDRARPAVPSPDNLCDRDPRIGVSRMSRQYCAALTCVALAGLANGVGIDLSPEHCTVVFRGNVPFSVALRGEYPLRCAERPTRWPVTGPTVATLGQLREYVWTSLYAQNLGPLFAAAVDLVRVPDRLLWTNAAEWVAVVMDSALEYLDPAAAEPVVAECRALLDAETLPGLGGAPNPLRGRVEWQPFDGGEPAHGIQTRHPCCLVYLHSDRAGLLCQNCPLLPLPDRAALVRERRGVGKTQPGGPAERRSTEVGRRLLPMGRPGRANGLGTAPSTPPAP